MTGMLMLIFLAAYAAIVLAKARYHPEKEAFFDVHDSVMLKGMFCVIVVLVHIPAAYQNRIQDMLGSFAYVGVTFFFMTSAYGLKVGAAHKEGYLHGFWLKRLPAILVPALLCNAVEVGISAACGYDASVLDLIDVDGWVKVLLLFYLVFWLVYAVSDKLGLAVRGNAARDALICLVVISFSLIDRLTPLKITLIWPTESVGFAYGILLADCAPWLKKKMADQWMKKSVLLFLLGGVTGVAYLKFKTVAFLGDYCLKIFLGFVLLMLILQLLRKIEIGNKVLAFLGGISYEVYLLHGPLFLLVGKAAGIENSGLFIWTIMILTVVLAVVVKKLGKPVVSGIRKTADRMKRIREP